MLGAAIGVLAGCGSESPRTAANAINLRAGDAAGFVASSGPGRRVTYGPIGRCDGGLASSHGLPGYPSLGLSYRYGKPPAQTRTPELNQFLGGSQGQVTTAHSVVYVFDSRSAALRELGALGSAHAQACILRQIPAARREGDVAVGIAGHPNEAHPPSIAVEKDVRVFRTRPARRKGGRVARHEQELAPPRPPEPRLRRIPRFRGWTNPGHTRDPRHTAAIPPDDPGTLTRPSPQPGRGTRPLTHLLPLLSRTACRC